MTERFRELEAIFLAAVELPAAERARFVAAACGRDLELARKAHRLLAAHVDPSGPLEHAPSTELAETTGHELLGRRIGGYTITSILGSGGMGRIFEAVQENPRRTVALKMLTTPPVSRTALRRFRLESEILAMLHHPGIAQIFEGGVLRDGEREIPWFAMERLVGKTLDEHIARSAPSLARRLEIFLDIAGAVQHAHDHGVIHRDLKPSNIVVGTDGRVKVFDFGAALVAVPGTSAGRTTVHGTLVGTVAYMSPEQTRKGETIDVRSDVYTLGVLLYEMLTGRLPYGAEASSIAETIHAIRDAEPTPLGLGGGRLARDLDTIVAKALAKEAARRYQSVGELAADVRRATAGQPIVAHAPSVLRRLARAGYRHRALVIGAIVVAFAFAVGRFTK